MGIRRIPRAHLFNGAGEETGSVENIRIFRKEAEDQPRHEMVHVGAAISRAPVGIVFQQLDVESVQSAGGPDVECAFAHLLHGADSSQRKEKSEMVWKIRIGAGNRLARFN